MQKLDPKFVWLSFLGHVWMWFLCIIFWIMLLTIIRSMISGVIEAMGEGDFPPILFWVWIVIPAVAMIVYLPLSFIWAKLTYHYYRYELIESEFRKERGVIIKKYTTIPYDRIQNIDISRAVFERMLGLSTLKIETAGASEVIGAEGRLPGLSKEVAEQLRDELIRRARLSRGGL